MTTHRGYGSLFLSVEHEQGAVRVVVRDTGPGIPPASLERIFDPFHTTKAPGEGTGLGLSVSRALAREHDGALAARNHPDGGAAFTLTLPAIPEHGGEPESEQIEGAPVAEPASGGRVLVVDDDDMVRQTLTEMLELSGWQATPASTGEEAIGALEAHSFDVVLCDMKMPNMDGREFYQRVRARWPQLCPRIIFATGDTVGAASQHFIERTGNVCLSKPFGRAEVEPALRHVMTTRGEHHA
jgi:two-component system NtrC family sensor kinase